ncbi:MAG: hypothetical protein C4320_08025, partial [Armatimonadota bacterium]
VSGSGGVGILFDRAGSDLYPQGSGSPGTAEGGGLAIFLDASGNDATTGRSEPPADGSVSLFVSLGSGMRFGSQSLGGGNAGSEPPESPPIGSLSVNPDRIARAAGLLATRRGGFREAGMRELAAFGVPGLDGGLKVLDELDDGGIDALARLVQMLGEPGRRRAILAIGDRPSAAGLRLAGMARLPLPSSSIIAALDDPLRRRAAVLAFADGLPLPELVGTVLPLVL